MKFKINFTEKFLKIYKYLICLTPFIFSIVVVSNNLVDFKGIFESGIYINMAKNWLNESNNEAPLRRLPLYPIFIYLIFKIFGTDNLIALLFFQSVLGYFTFLYLIKTLTIFCQKSHYLELHLIPLCKNQSHKMFYLLHQARRGNFVETNDVNFTKSQ